MTAHDNNKMLDYLRHHQDDMVEHLKQLIELESPTSDKGAVDKLGDFLARELQMLGGEVDIVQKDEVGNLVRGRWNKGDGGVLILSHMDTVWDIGTVAGRPTQVAGDRIYGVGSMDMKGGIVIALWALRALRELDLFPDLPITYLFNSDEEIGSPHSGERIEEEARKHQAVFVTEPPQDGKYKTARKGVSTYTVKAIGRAAHSGADHEQGINAIEELSHQIIKIQSFTDYDIGTTTNVGTITGGTRPNVVPAEASAIVNVRVTTRKNGELIHEKMMGLTPVHPEAQVIVEGGVTVPPMERTPEIVALFKQAQSLAEEMSIKLDEGSTGGGSDGNRTASIGIPTLDGMGIVGEGGHSIHEYGEISSMPERAAIMAAMLRKL